MAEPRACDDPLSILGQLTFADMQHIASGNKLDGYNGAARATAQRLMQRNTEISTPQVMEAFTTLGILCVMARPDRVVAP